MPSDQDIAVQLARIEGKIDTLVTSSADHEGRIRVIEGKGYVTSRQLWAGLLGSATVSSSIIAALALLVNK